MKKWFLTVLCMFVLASFTPIHTHAQSLSLSLQPPLVETAVMPGKSVLVGFTVANTGDPSIVSAHISTFVPKGTDGHIVLTDSQDTPIRFNLENSDIQLEKPFLLRDGKGQQLLLKMRVPEGTPEGDYYFTFYIQNELGRRLEGAPSAQAQARIGSNILMTVTKNGDVDISGSIGKLSAQTRHTLQILGKKYPIIESADAIPVTLILQNTGKNMIKPQGVLTLTGSIGQSATYSLVPQNILKQSSRIIQASQSGQVVNNGPDASMTLKGFYIGKYSIEADVHFGDTSEGDKATFVFYAIPYKLIVAFIGAIFLSFIALKKFRQSEYRTQ